MHTAREIDRERLMLLVSRHSVGTIIGIENATAKWKENEREREMDKENMLYYVCNNRFDRAIV